MASWIFAMVAISLKFDKITVLEYTYIVVYFSSWSMKNLFRHVQVHHKKYLFGIFGGYAVVKLFLLVLGLSVVQYSYNTIFAE